MLNKFYCINKKIVNIYCEINEYEKKLINWMSAFDEIEVNKSDYYIKINFDNVKYKYNNKGRVIKGRILKTDLYPLIYNFIANIFSENNELLMHSEVICYNNKGILVIGDFGSGKTTLTNEAINNKFIKVSSDQTALKMIDNELYMCFGSNYVRNRNGDDVLIEENKNFLKIDIIVNIIGLCDKGIVSFDEVNDDNFKYRSLYRHCSWHFDIPLVTDNICLDFNKQFVKQFITKISCPMYNIRGDKKKVLLKIKEIL